MSALIERLRAGRKLEIPVGSAVYYARRPTWEELGDWALQGNSSNAAIARQVVTGWSGVRASDLLPGADDVPVEFDAALWSESLGDMPEVCAAIATRVIDAAHEFVAQRDANRKN